MLDNNYYIYRHIRPDTNEVFYIGKGNNLDKRLAKYTRAKNKGSRRSKYWKRVVNKNNGNFKVEILYECNTEQEANEKEIEFISLYGRKDLGLGTLVNLTDGGDGAVGVVMTNEVRKKHSISMQGDKNWQSKKVIDVLSGKIYITVKEAEKELNMKKGLLGKYLNKKNSNQTSLLYLDEYNNSTENEIKTSILQKKKTAMMGKNHSQLSIQKMSKNSINKGGKKVLDILSGEIYPTASEVSRLFGINLNTLIGKLNNRRRNNTRFKYL